MSRARYGPTPVLNADGTVARNATGGLVYEDEAKTIPVTDLALLPGGASVASVPADASGRCAFYGPDARVTSLWVDFGGGVVQMFPGASVDAAIIGGGGGGGGAIADGAVDTQQLADSAVTSAKIANGTVAPGDLDRSYVEIPAGLVKGDLLVFNGTTIVRVGAGATGTVLTSAPTASAGVVWQAPATSPTGAAGFSQVIGNGTDVRFTVPHGLGTFNLIAQAWSNIAPRCGIAVEIVDLPSTNELVVQFGTAPATDGVRLVVLPIA